MFVHIIKMPQGLLFNRTLNFVFMLRFDARMRSIQNFIYSFQCGFVCVCVCRYINFVYYLFSLFIWISLLFFSFFFRNFFNSNTLHTAQRKNAYNRHEINRWIEGIFFVQLAAMLCYYQRALLYSCQNLSTNTHTQKTFT